MSPFNTCHLHDAADTAALMASTTTTTTSSSTHSEETVSSVSTPPSAGSPTLAPLRIPPFDPSVSVQKIVTTRIPTLEGEMHVHVYHSSREPGKDHMALVYGDLQKLQNQTVLCRIHSECFTGEVLGSLRCDCREQLHNAQRQMATAGAGVIIYLRQEGRGIGLVNKLKAYNLQDKGLDTYDANVALGHGADERTYDEAILMLKDLGIKSVRLLTNNQEKVAILRAGGINVEERIEMRPQIVTPDILAYLHTKVERMNHTLSLNLVPLMTSVPQQPQAVPAQVSVKKIEPLYT